jgi:hypothetical protein
MPDDVLTYIGFIVGYAVLVVRRSTEPANQLLGRTMRHRRGRALLLLACCFALCLMVGWFVEGLLEGAPIQSLAGGLVMGATLGSLLILCNNRFTREHDKTPADQRHEL